MGVNENIKKLRCRADLTQEQLAELIDVSRSAITQWEAGYSSPRIGTVQKLASLFRVPISAIVDDREVIPIKGAKPAQIGSYVAVPLLGKVHAGDPTEAETIDADMVEIPAWLFDRDPETYTVIVEGDCMDKIYPEGCVIAISPNRMPDNGSIAVVTIDDADTVVRRIYKTPQTLVLAPESHNPEHKDIVITQTDRKSVV